MAIRNVIFVSIPTLRAEFIVVLISVLSDQGRHFQNYLEGPEGVIFDP